MQLIQRGAEDVVGMQEAPAKPEEEAPAERPQQAPKFIKASTVSPWSPAFLSEPTLNKHTCMTFSEKSEKKLLILFAIYSLHSSLWNLVASVQLSRPSRYCSARC